MQMVLDHITLSKFEQVGYSSSKNSRVLLWHPWPTA